MKKYQPDFDIWELEEDAKVLLIFNINIKKKEFYIFFKNILGYF